MEDKLQKILRSMIDNDTPFFKVFALDTKYETTGRQIAANDPKGAEAPPVEVAFQKLSHAITDEHEMNGCKRFKIQLRGNSAAGRGITELIIDLGIAGTAVPGLGGVPNSPLGSIDTFRNEVLGMMQMQTALQEPKIQLERERNELLMEKMKFEIEREGWIKEKTKREAELNDLQKRYESRAASAAEGASRAIEGILNGFVAGDKKVESPLGATVEANEEPKSQAEIIIEGFATATHTAHTDGLISLQQVAKIGKTVKGLLDKYQEDNSNTIELKEEAATTEDTNSDNTQDGG